METYGNYVMELFCRSIWVISWDHSAQLQSDQVFNVFLQKISFIDKVVLEIRFVLIS